MGLPDKKTVCGNNSNKKRQGGQSAGGGGQELAIHIQVTSGLRNQEDSCVSLT